MNVSSFYRVDWPYQNKIGEEEVVNADVLVLGGGIAGCWAALGAAKKGAKVILVEKGALIRSGSSGAGVDHWESATTNPCSRITPEEMTAAMIKSHGGYNNGISHYIECREGYDRLIEMEKLGGKVRDTDDAFTGAEFRDEKTKLLFAYDYENRYTIRVWGTTFKPALTAACMKAGIKIFERTMATSLLTTDGKQGSDVIGATGIHCRTGKFIKFKAKATVLAMCRPARLWLFSPGFPGISEFRPMQCNGDGHAMGWKAGARFTMMEKSVKGEWSGGRSFPPYGTGNTHNTWYACSMADAEGKEIPWMNRDGVILKTVSERYRPAPGQKFYLKGGGEPDIPCYEYQGPEIMSVEDLLSRGYKLPFYADLSAMPEHERNVIWGVMVGEEGKTKVPIMMNYTAGGFESDKDMLQSYGQGWKSGSFLPQERQLFGIPGGIMNDWNLQTNLGGLFAAGDQLFASNCHGHAAATGHYAGEHAADYARSVSLSKINGKQAALEKERVLSPLLRENGIRWQDLNMSISKIMQNYCGDIKSEELLRTGLDLLKQVKEHEAPLVTAENPHELMRTLEVFSILTNAKIVLNACLARKASSKYLHFNRSDYPNIDPPEWHKFITVECINNSVKIGELPVDYYGDLSENYEKHKKKHKEKS